MLIQKIKDFLAKHQISGKIAIATSGGIDSLCLAITAKEAGADIVSLIVDHKLRAISTEHAEQTQRTLAKNNITSEILTWKHSIITRNLEAQARSARYDLMISYCKNNNIKYLLLGHHIDDQIETFILNLLRGSGIDGLCAMPEIRMENVIYLCRPFLDTEKDELKRYLLDRKIDWVEDETNQDSDIKRNKIRNLLQEIEPDLYKKRILLAIDNLQNTKSIIDKHMLALFNNITNVTESNATIEYKIYKDLLQTERTWLLNAVLNKFQNTKNQKNRLDEINQLDANILSNKKSTLKHCIIYVKEDNIIIERE